MKIITQCTNYVKCEKYLLLQTQTNPCVRPPCPDEVNGVKWLNDFYHGATKWCWEEPSLRWDFSSFVEYFETYLSDQEKNEYKKLEDEYASMQDLINKDMNKKQGPKRWLCNCFVRRPESLDNLFLTEEFLGENQDNVNGILLQDFGVRRYDTGHWKSYDKRVI